MNPPVHTSTLAAPSRFSPRALAGISMGILGAVLLLGEILGRSAPGTTRWRYGAIAAGSVVVAVVANFAWFWPIYTDALITQQEWLQRIWFRRWI